MRTIRFLQGHRIAARLLARWPFRAIVARLVWRELDADPAFSARMRAVEVGFDAGRGVVYKARALRVVSREDVEDGFVDPNDPDVLVL